MGNQDEAIDLCPISWLNKWTYVSRTMVNTGKKEGRVLYDANAYVFFYCNGIIF